MRTGYNGNENLKKVRTNIQFTKEQADEYIKCMKDPLYFIKNYVKIVNVDTGLVPLKLWPFQEDLIKTIVKNRMSIHKLSRQIGKTTCVAATILWYVLFNEHYSVAILANKQDQAFEIMSRVQLAFEHLPKWLQQGVKTWNAGDIELENGSKILASSTSGSAIRGKSINLVYLDEFAFVPYNLQEEFFRSVFPTISSGQSTKIVITSTPNGMDMFYKIWDQAIKGQNRFKPFEAFWRDVPGRGPEWKEEQLKDLTERQFNIEFEAQFIGSTNTLIDPAKLAALTYDENPEYQTEFMSVYYLPDPDKIYLITVDCSEGLGLDYHAFTVFDITQAPYEIVATFRSNNLSPLILPSYIHDTAKKYNNAHVLIETQSAGSQVAQILHNDLEYENVLMTTRVGGMSQTISEGFSGSQRFGVHMSAGVKNIGCTNLKTLIENDQLVINDFSIIQELFSFVQQKKTFKAEEGKNDDMVMTLVLFGWISTLEYFKNLTDINIRERIISQNFRKIEDEMLPFGFIVSGNSDFEDDDGFFL